MARAEDERTHSASGEEEDGSSEQLSQSESDKNTPSTPVTKKPSESSKQPVQPAPDVTSSEEDESGSESESDSLHSPMNSGEPVPAVEPIVSKPMENPPEAVTKPSSEPTAPSSPEEEEESSSKVKRPAPQVKTPEPKKAKKKGGDTEDGSGRAKKTIGDDPKKQLFQRLWSEEDEVVILKGICDYTADPNSDMNAFHEFIKNSLHVDVSKTQLTDKVRKMKRKYVNNLMKEKNGKEKTFSKPHEQVCYNLSKKIWGFSAGEDTNIPKTSGTAKKYLTRRNGVRSEVNGADGHQEVGAMEVDADFERFFPGGSVSLRDSANQMIRNGWKLVAESKRSEWEKKWKKLMVEEVELYSRFLGLMHEQGKLVSKAMKSAQE